MKRFYGYDWECGCLYLVLRLAVIKLNIGRSLPLRSSHLSLRLLSIFRC